MEDWKHCPQFAPLADLIRSHGSFAVIAHVHPDGDAIGSTLALGEALKQMGKKVVMMNEDGVPPIWPLCRVWKILFPRLMSRWMWK